jgi:ATP-binding cassette subfamily F protein 3
MATLLQINNLNKSYGPHVIFDQLTLSIGEKQKIGVIGRNGAGKSTLFKIVVGDEEYNSGEVIIHEQTRLGYLTQHDPFLPGEKVMDFCKRLSHKEDWQCASVAGKFQIKKEMLDAEITALSGGYQMRVKLIGLLLQDPNLLLLDEPTNYLDLSTLLLLEQFLRTYRGTFLLISHDREFLKNTCDETMEIDQGKAFLYPRPIEEYLDYKEQQIEMAKRYNKKIEREKRHLQSFVDRFRAQATKATQAQSKMKQIAKLKTIDIVHPLSTTRIRIPEVESKKGTALSLDELSIGYPNKVIASNISFDIDRGERIAIVGENGQGKTTFLKTIAGALEPLAGKFRWGPHIRIGYYAQHVPTMLDPYDQVGKYLTRMAGPEIKNEQILQMAGNFLFHGDDLNKSVSILSGGEKARLCLAGLLLQRNTVLLLDEPTNHLDFETVEALAFALHDCNSTIFFISHNRTFVNVVATRIVEVNRGKVTRYHHNYEEYVYHLEEQLGVDMNAQKETSTAPETVTEPDARKELHSEIKKQKKELQKIEMEIMELEKEKQKLTTWFEQNPTTYSREKTAALHDTIYFIQEQEKLWMEVQAILEEMQKKL